MSCHKKEHVDATTMSNFTEISRPKRDWVNIRLL